MLLQNRKTNGNGNIFNQFQQFKKQVQQSGKNPQEILNELMASGKVNKKQLSDVMEMAKQFSYLIK